MILHKIKRLINSFFFILGNISYKNRLKEIENYDFKSYFITGLDRTRYRDFLSFYKHLNDKELDYQKKALYKYYGKRLCFVAIEKAANQIVGVEFYYFNRRDKSEDTIHQAFRGVHPTWCNKGVATSITQYAVKVFSNAGLKGLSSRVSVNNKASLLSNQKVGFKIKEKYYDKKLCQNRYYMVCDLVSRKE